MASTVASAIRPGLRETSVRQPSGSPHTPTGRFLSSPQSSPGSYSFRAEEDPIIVELDPRGLSAGFQGESAPQCHISFTPQNARRIGDYRIYLSGFRRKRRHDVAQRSKDYELWRNDLADVDLGLLEDMLERAVREAYNKHLLVDAGSARLVLVLPSLVPHPVISTILTLLFERWKYTTITLLPAPTMAVAGAGLRSGLVVDLGWEETVITAIYEYREVQVYRSVRGMKELTVKVGALLETVRRVQDQSIRDSLVMDFDFVEEFVDRAGAAHALMPVPEDLATTTEKLQLEDEASAEAMNQDTASLLIDWPTNTSSRPIAISRQALHQVTSDTLITLRNEEHRDDHEQSVSQLLYRTLLALSSDVRSMCMSRIIFSGRGSTVAGLPQCILETSRAVIKEHGWTPVRGKHQNTKRKGLAELTQARAAPPDARHGITLPGKDDPVEDRLFKERSKNRYLTVSAVLRQVDSLGPWAGASIIASLKAKSFVDIERERFLSHGLAGAHRDFDPSALHQQRTIAAKGNERTSWTLAGWA